VCAGRRIEERVSEKGSLPEGHADRHPHIARILVGSILKGAVRLYRLHPARVAGASLVVILPLILVSRGLHALETSLPPGTTDEPYYLVALLPSAAEFLALLGLVLLGGVMDELVGASVRGEPPPSLAEAVRSLPFGILMVADVVVTTLVTFGALFGAVPGLVIASLVGIVGPLVNIERHGPVRAVRHSFRLTWPHAWVAMGVVVPIIGVEAAGHAVLLRAWDSLGLLGELAVESVLILTVGAVAVLSEVVLAYALLARDPGSSVERMVKDAVTGEGR
jgi:hypothetical protein